ncbi:MAG: hypothetical protein K2X81_00435, partial [Candidatus Obscuribacterales bacterium]|nr:hypothetical protein [Candidatus Obscuribacterales bacterium]
STAQCHNRRSFCFDRELFVRRIGKLEVPTHGPNLECREHPALIITSFMTLWTRLLVQEAKIFQQIQIKVLVKT